VRGRNISPHYTELLLAPQERQRLLAQQQEDDIQPFFKQLANDPDTPDSGKHLMQAVGMILHGSHDPALADDPTLYYRDTAEIFFLIERLGQ
jgi:hypothetical protein